MSVATAPNSQGEAAGIGDNSGLTEEELAAWAEDEREGAGEVETAFDDDGEGEPQPGDEVEEQQPVDDEPPEFWAADRKAVWSKIADPEIRAAIKGHVEEVSRGTARKLEEGAAKVRQAEESAKGALDNQNQLAAWWQANGARIQIAVMGRWAGVDWNKLAEEDPGAFVKAKQAFENDQGIIRDMTQRHQAELQKIEQRRKSDHQRDRATEHAKLAQELPDDFGPAKAQQTYDTLSDYLLKNGIASDRLAGIYEASVVKIVQKAYKYDQLQARAKGITTRQQPGQPASTTPKRFVPGPGTGNRSSGAGRQAIQRLRDGQNLSDDDVTEIFG